MPITLTDIQAFIISGTAANYSALPAANTVPNQYYWVLAEQGTWWLPGSLGGTYYNKGIYRSNGTIWEFQATPANASQATVNAGIDDTQFVTSKTFNNSTQLAAKASLTGTETLTNKRITERVTSITSSVTPTPNVDTDDLYKVTALAAAATFGAPTGTPTDGQALLKSTKDNGTARALLYDSIYKFSTDQPAPTTTIVGKTLYEGYVWNSVDSKWDCLGWIQV